MKLIIEITDGSENQGELLAQIGDSIMENYENVSYGIDSSVTFATQGDLDRYIATHVQTQRHTDYNSGKITAIREVREAIDRVTATIREEPEEVGNPNVQIAKFAIGEMVRLVKGFKSVFEIGTVKFQADRGIYTYQFVGAIGWYGESELEAAPKFAVGDKVRLTMSNALGEVIEVLDATPHLPGHKYRVRLANGDCFYYGESSLNAAVDA